MKSLFLSLSLLLVATAYGQTYPNWPDSQALQEGRSVLKIAIFEDGHVKAVAPFRLTGRVKGQIVPTSDGGYTCRIVLFGKDRRQVMRGRYTLTRLEHPFTAPGAPQGLTTLEIHRQFQGRCSDARMLKPRRLQFNFQDSDLFYPDLY